MLKFESTIKLEKNFGDFGRDYGVIDLDFARTEPDIGKLVKILESSDFENVFRTLLPAAFPSAFAVNTFSLCDGRILNVVPALARMYNLAGQLALAKILGKDSIVAGTFLRDFATAAAETATKAGFDKIQIALGRDLCADQELVKKLEATGAKVDAETCAEYLDRPYDYGMVFFGTESPDYFVPEDANYGHWPMPALAGVLAGLYGADLLEKLGHVPEACVVPITTGTEAIGAFKALIDTDCILATAEDTVAQEYHVIKSGCYTLATRSANEENPVMVLCPELADWWRKGRVLRLGCDRLHAVDTSFLAPAAISPLSARAAALAFEASGCRELTVLEAK